MPSSELVEQVEILASPLAAEMGLELVDTSFKKEAGGWMLRLLIDKEGGISLEDCQGFSRSLEGLLDAADPISHAYTLEVSSAGLDRPLKTDKDFERFAGRLVGAHTYAAVEGQKHFRGLLRGLEGGNVMIEEAGRVKTVPRDMISRIHLEIDVNINERRK